MSRLGRLRVLSGNDVGAILKAHGFSVARTRGSHAVYQRRTEAGTTTVPVPLHRTLKRGTLASILRQSGLPKALFEE
jgi:predicted RNA binding protein YcfA (HicA-like mRNA interferase family)